MAQRETPAGDDAALGQAVQLDNAETLHGAAGGGDALDAGYVPPDRPYGLDEDGVTGAGMREGDSLDERLARERPEAQPSDTDRSGRIVMSGEGAALETSDAMQAEDVGIDGGAASAEEAAVHSYAADARPDAPRETEPSPAASPALEDPELERSLAEDGDRDRAVARRDALRDAAALDREPEASGAPAAASGRDDVGPGSGLPQQP